ncbi:MAG TPA: hypothetical protein VGO11_20065 [Chthoniobacteraceae bacterium]|jgi:hypothetical protein|nr:hypothetical protein [Chthoniobacteraceae bacterium]
MKTLVLLAACLITHFVSAQEQTDLGDPGGKLAAASIQRMAMRVRVTRAEPASERLHVSWRRGGEGLGGTVTKGDFLGETNDADLGLNEWSAWAPLEQVIGRAGSWTFPSVVVSPGSPPADKLPGKKVASPPILATSVQFEFAEKGKVFQTFKEDAPKGATVGFAFPGKKLDARGGANPDFVASLQGLSGHARARREALEKVTPKDAVMPKQFGIIGHLGGYGESAAGSKGAGYGVRFCNPEMLADECRSMRMLGVNGVVDALKPIDTAGFGDQFRRIHWGGPGSGSPMNFFGVARAGQPEPDGCPFDPALKANMATVTAKAIEEHKASGAKENWGLWTDEIGVFAKDHIMRCERCAAKFRDYLRAQKVPLSELGAKSWDEVKPFDIWGPPKVKGAKAAPPPEPANAAEALRYYYTSRFMTYATGQVFPEPARAFKKEGILLYAMQGPTPSWSGSSLDWHEFYDLGANTAFVFETSNRDPRSWQWESYLGDIGRGIAARHELPMGSLVKPHRGAPAQRMLTLVARGVRAFEWYTYGPDYAKGDSFSQSPELLERVAHAAQFLGRGEDFLYGAKFEQEPEVAFVSPRASEIWGRGSAIGLTAFEDAKWVYLALAHAHVPVAILSEQQLAEGKLDRFKVLYVVGPNLRRDAAAQIEAWVRKGGTLWTDALGLSRDEANQPATALNEMFGLGERKLESWGSVEPYKATSFTPMVEKEVPAGAAFEFRGAKLQASIGREALEGKGIEPLATFADGKAAVARHAHGKGEVIAAGFWAGLTYSAKVRRADYDMHADFDPALRALIAEPAVSRKLALEISEPLVEAVPLENKGRHGIALMNWAYASSAGKESPVPAENVRITFRPEQKVTKVRSQVHGPLTLKDGSVVVPKVDDVDLLYVE